MGRVYDAPVEAEIRMIVSYDVQFYTHVSMRSTDPLFRKVHTGGTP